MQGLKVDRLKPADRRKWVLISPSPPAQLPT